MRNKMQKIYKNHTLFVVFMQICYIYTGFKAVLVCIEIQDITLLLYSVSLH